ncbi:hypothetical protein AV521_04205 [Streptomyces sp. IMTB 2501]|nr:hypothetical protein AV521_04205 [Streptomyces sp. IMTB 2501]
MTHRGTAVSYASCLVRPSLRPTWALTSILRGLSLEGVEEHAVLVVRPAQSVIRTTNVASP